MLVVADSSPLIALINIAHVDILPALFGTVVIPPQVAREMAHATRPQVVRDFASSRPTWLVEQAPATIEPIIGLHAGEMAAISLARELNADFLLIDEIVGRRAATDRHLAITGTIGVLELAANKGLLDLGNSFTALKHTDFWISHKLLDERLRLFQARHSS